MQKQEKKIEVPQYDGSYCTSACGNDYDCPHSEAFDEEHGIRRSGLDFDINHDNGERRFGVAFEYKAQFVKQHMNLMLDNVELSSKRPLFGTQHLPSDYPKASQCECGPFEECHVCEEAAIIADQEQKWGEERSVTE